MLRNSRVTLGTSLTELPSLMSRGVANAFFQGLSAAGRLHPLANPEEHKVEVIRDIPYAGSAHPMHRLDIYRPTDAQSESLPVVLYLHGGGFSLLSKETHWIMALVFARAGYLVCNVGYRLADRYPFPAALEDAVDALQWVAGHVREWGGDPERLVLAGESAGANLVTALAVCTSYRRPEPFAQKAWNLGIVPRAVVAGCGILQVSDPGRFARRRRLPWWVSAAINDVSRGYLRQLKDGTDLADPLLILESGAAPQRPLPAFFGFAGTRDPILDDTRRLGLALERLGVPHEVKIYPGELHAFHALLFREAARRCWREKLAFLNEQLIDTHVAPLKSGGVRSLRHEGRDLRDLKASSSE